MLTGPASPHRPARWPYRSFLARTRPPGRSPRCSLRFPCRPASACRLPRHFRPPYIWGPRLWKSPPFCGFRFTSVFFRANYSVKLLGMLALAFSCAPEGKLGPGRARPAPERLCRIGWRTMLLSLRRPHRWPCTKYLAMLLASISARAKARTSLERPEGRCVICIN